MENTDLIKILEALSSLSKKIESIKQEPKSVIKTRSDEIDKLASALAKAQGEFKVARPSKENNYYKSKYSDLKEVVMASRPALSKNGLSVVQPPVFVDPNGISILETTLMHASGQWIMSRMRIIPPKADVQALGSYISYLRRYAYGALIGVVSSDEDDDGEIAVHEFREDFEKGTKLNHKYNPKEVSIETITKEQLEELRYELGEHTDLAEEILEKMKLRTLSDMPKEKFLAAIRRVRQIVQKREGK